MSASIGSIKRRDPDLTLLKEYAATRKVRTYQDAGAAPDQSTRIFRRAVPDCGAGFVYKGNEPEHRKAKCRMIRLRLVKNARSLFLRNRGDKRFFMIDAGMHSL